MQSFFSPHALQGHRRPFLLAGPLLLFLVLLSAAGTGRLIAQEPDTAMEATAALLKSLNGCMEGFARPLQGESIDYPRLNTSIPSALLTRATTGEMAIAWETPPTPRSLPDLVSFAISAGIAVRKGEVHFQLSVNGTPRFTFATVADDHWTVSGTGGGTLQFLGALRDRFNDAFGILKITLPSSWLRPGEPVRLQVVGEKAGSRDWFMVFKDPGIIAYLREKVENEATFRLTVRAVDGKGTAAFTGPSYWAGRQLRFIAANGKETTVSLPARQAGPVTFDVPGEGAPPKALALDNEELASFTSARPSGEESHLYQKKHVRLTSRTEASGAWTLDYHSTYFPGLGTSLADLSSSVTGSASAYLITSSHQDIAWMDSPAQCEKDRDEKVISPALALLAADPAYCYDIEDVLSLREYLGRHPDRSAEIAGYIRQGRLGIGATYTQPYEDLCSAEMLVRQFYAGRKWLRKALPGCDTRIAWNPDVPGRTLQAAQVMRQAGVRYLFISRFGKGLYDWRSPDGSTVMMYTPGHYGLIAERTAGAPFHETVAFLASQAAEWSGRVANGSASIPVVYMSDMSTPVNFDGLIRGWNSLRSIKRPDGSTVPLALPHLKYATASQFLDAAASEGRARSTVDGDRPNIWLYIHGPTHHWAVSAKREADHLLPGAEIFSTVDCLLRGSFNGYPGAALTEAWEAQVYPDHGWGGKNGEITDSLFRAKYEHAQRVGGTIRDRAIASIAAQVKPKKGRTIPVVVFNSLSWRRSAPVECTVTFRKGELKKRITLTRADGTAIPWMLSALERHSDGSLKSARLSFVADVPSVGYATYYVGPSSAALSEPGKKPPAGALARTAAPVLENSFYRVTLAPGGIRQIVDKELGRELLATDKFLGGELFTMQSVGEDAGEWSDPQQPTMEGFDRVSRHAPAWTVIESTPVRQVAQLRVMLEHATVVQRLILHAGVKQIDLETDLLNFDGTRYREFRLAFPVRMSSGQVAYEVPFGVVEVGKSEMKGAAGERYTSEVARVRPRGIDRWIGVSDSAFGLTLTSSVAVWDYKDPTDQPIGGPMLQPVLLASRRSCHGEGPWYLQKGDHHYRFSLTSHEAGWRNGRHQGVSAAVPLAVVVRPATEPAAALPGSGSFFQTGAANLALTTMKKCEDDDHVVLRLYDDEGKASASSLSFMAPLQAAWKTNIIEEEPVPLPFTGNSIPLQVGHHGIVTLKVSPLIGGKRAPL